jgi:OmpA-OmpF porin, OOP family
MAMTPTNLPNIGGLSEQLKACQQAQFTGRLRVQAIDSQQWSLFIKLGRLVWANGGVHWLRRWQRLIKQHSSQIVSPVDNLATFEPNQHRDYDLLILWSKNQNLTGGQSANIVRATVAEVLFDILQQEALAALTLAADDQALDTPLLLINPQQAMSEAERTWNAWSNVGLANLSPNLAPLMQQPEQLKAQASEKVYQVLVQAIDGDKTLRDLALFLNQDLQLFTKLLKVYIGKEWIKLVEIPDLLPASPPAEANQPVPKNSQPAQNQPESWSNGLAALRSRKWAIPAMLSILVVGGSYGVWQLLNRTHSSTSLPTSNTSGVSATETITVAGDSFSGYSTFRSASFQAALNQAGINLKYQDAPGSQGAALLDQGKVDIELTTLDQFLRLKPQGKIVGLISHTVGADALVLNTKRYPSLTSVAGLNQLVKQTRSQGQQLALALPENTPSEYLALLLSTKFDSFNLSDFRVQKVANVSEGWQLLQDPNQKVAAAILREPDVTQARQQGYTVALSSQEVPGEIVDVIVASDRVLRSQPEQVSKLLETYYRRVDADIRDASTLRDQISEDGKLSPGDAKTVMEGIDFFTAPEAKDWLVKGRLEKQMGATAAVLALAGKLDQVPPTSTNLVADQFIDKAASNTEALIKLIRAANPKLADKLAGKPDPAASTVATGQMQAGTKGLQANWEIKFKSDSTQLTAIAKQTLKRLVEQAAEPFNRQEIVIQVIGHTSKRGQPATNQALSLKRAQIVIDYLHQLGLKGTIMSEGKGSSQPLPGIPGPDRRNQRAEIRLTRNN